MAKDKDLPAQGISDSANPYETPGKLDASPVSEHKAGSIANAFSLVFAFILATASCLVSLGFTCVGMIKIGANGPVGLLLGLTISGLTTAFAFILSRWGFRKIFGGFKRR